MCRSKQKLAADVVPPASKTSSSRVSSRRTSKNYQKNQSVGSSLLEPSTASNNFDFTNTSSYKDDSWRSSATSRTSLSSLRDSLPENPHAYAFSEISAATNNFLTNRYSSSSSSAAWRCVVRGSDVVVFRRKLRRQMDTAELRDRLLMICKSHHTSLIKLRGASISGSYIYLVYDYVRGANLADCLRNPKNPNFTVLSSWMARVQIAADLAHGLDYIHNSTGLGKSFIHNHIKTSSIIVTEPSLVAKICHFGTAELCGETFRESKPELKKSNSGGLKFEGTRGYMSPEFQFSGVATQKSDVYAFGVVVLEILSGEEPLKFRFDEGGYVRVSVIETAREAVDGGGMWRWIDRKLKDSYPVDVAEKLARLGLECVAEDPENRPDMSLIAGRVSKLYLESQSWAEKMGSLPTDFSVSMAPR